MVFVDELTTKVRKINENQKLYRINDKDGDITGSNKRKTIPAKSAAGATTEKALFNRRFFCFDLWRYLITVLLKPNVPNPAVKPTAAISAVPWPTSCWVYK
jgi:hypothetical protein